MKRTEKRMTNQKLGEGQRSSDTRNAVRVAKQHGKRGWFRRDQVTRSHTERVLQFSDHRVDCQLPKQTKNPNSKTMA